MLRSKKEIDRHVRELLNKVKSENDRKSKGHNIARLYFAISEYECARRYIAEFLSFMPKSPEGHKLLAQIYEKLGQKDKAVNSYKTSYTILGTQKDLVLKICDLYADLDVDSSVRTFWADEGEKVFPHHNSVVKLRQSLMLTNPSQSKEEQEQFYLREIKANPLSLMLHVKFIKLLLDWAKEEEGKYEEAYNYIIKVESRKPFPHSLEWYQLAVEVLKDYDKWKKIKEMKNFEELFLSFLDRYVFESLASSCGPALSALCSPKEAAKRLQEFDLRLSNALKTLGEDSLCARHMKAQFYFHTAVLLSLLGKTESILYKDVYLGALLFHASFLYAKESRSPSTSSEECDSIKNQWYTLGHYRVSQSGHMLNQLAHAYRGQKHYLNKIQEVCLNERSRKHIYGLVFDSSSEKSVSSLLLTDENFMKRELAFVEPKTQLLCDQDVSVCCSGDLRELVWLYHQYSSANATSLPGKFFNFNFFRSIPFASSMETFAPETLSHLDVVAFIVATAYCQKANSDIYEDAVGTSCPSILAVYLHTPEQGEWWNAAALLCSNLGGKRVNRLRSILQNGLESVRHLGHTVLPLQLTIHLARYFTTCISDARDEGNSAHEIDSLEERAEYYWSKVVAYCRRSAKGNYRSLPKSRLFEVRRPDLSESELEEVNEEGELFIADRLSTKGRHEEAIQILARLKSPRAAFKRAMLYKKEAQSLLGNRTWHSLNLKAMNDYTTLLTQSRDALYLTLDRLKRPGEEPSDPLNQELSEELTRIEHSLATVTMEEVSDDHSDTDGTLGDPSGTPARGFHSSALMNGNASTPTHWGAPPFGGYSANLYGTPSSTSKVQRQEARPSPERLDAQVRHLTELQQNTIRNIEEHNAALRAQNEALLQTCQTMSAEFKENVAFYRSYIDQKSADADHVTPILDQMKSLQTAMKGLQLEVRTISAEISELRNMRPSVSKSEPLQLVTAGSSAPESQVPIDIASPAAMQGVYNNYMGFYGQQPVGSPLVAPTAIFNPCQPPFMPPSTLPEQTYLSTTSNTIMKSEATGSPLVASSLYQQQNLNLKTAQTKSSKEEVPASPDTGPPHSYQISLPTSSIAFSSVGQTLTASTPQTFNTEGLLSNVPAPLYSAVSTNQSPDKSAAKHLLVSTLPSTPVANSSLNLSSTSTPSFGQWPNSSSNFPAGPSPNQGLPSPSVEAKLGANKSMNESDHYVDDGHDPCPDFKPIIPLPAQVEVHTGEEEEKVLFEGRAKLYRFLDKEWKERGVGPLKILQNERQATVRVLMRRDQTLKICCNHHITPSMELTTMADSDKIWIWAAQDFADEKLSLEKFCCKFKTTEVAQEFFKAFHEGREIVEQGANTSKLEPSPINVAEGNSLAEAFKPDAGSWTCSTCLIYNDKDSLVCVACQSAKPGESGSESGTPFASAGTASSADPKVTFKFGITPQSSSTASTLTFLGDKSATPPSFSFGTPNTSAYGTPSNTSIFGTPTTTSGSIFGTPTTATFGTPTAPKPTTTITFGIPEVTSTTAAGSSLPSVGTTITPFRPSPQIAFGPSSSVTISPLKPGAAPSISLFKTNSFSSTSAPASTEGGSSTSGSTGSIVIVPSKDEGGKFSIDGFTFSSEPTLGTPKTKPEASAIIVTEKSESKKESIFSNFTFTSSKTPPASTFSLPATVPAVTTTIATPTTAVSSSPSTGTLFSNLSTSNTLTFGAVAVANSDKTDQSIFKISDAKAFQKKPLFKEASSPQTGTEKGANTSKDEVEDYEPQVDFKPVVPMPDLVEVKTGEEEEEKMFSDRAKLYRYDGQAKEWKERGVGEVKILKNLTTNKVRLLMRRDQTHKVCANHFLLPEMIITAMPNSEKAWVWAAHDFADEEMKQEKFAIRFKTQELANNFKSVFEDAKAFLLTVPADTSSAIPPTPAPVAETGAATQGKSLAEMFKPSAGSWECSMCLVVNEATATACAACSTNKDGSAPKTNSVFGNAKPFSFSSASSGTFSFGVPGTTSSSSSTGVTSTSTTSSASFTFGFNTSNSTPSSVAYVSSSTVSSSTTAGSTQPLNLSWKPVTKDDAGTPPPSTTSGTTTTVSTKPGTPGKNEEGGSGFTFGSPGKYEFSFSGVRSPRSRDTSTCESEGGPGADEYAEEEEDNLYFEPVVPLPEKVEVVTGEEDETVLFCHRAKLYRLKECEFKERGLGDMKILQHKKTGKIRLLMRREQVHKICLNHYLSKDLQFRRKDEKSICWVTTDFSEPEPTKESFAIRFKAPEITDAFASAIKDAQEKLGKPVSESASTPTSSSTTTTTTSSAGGQTSTPSSKFGVFGDVAVTSTPKSSQFSFGDQFSVSKKQTEKDTSSSSGSSGVEIVYEKKATPEQVERARKLFLPDNFYLYEDSKVTCPGCRGCSSDDFVFKEPTSASDVAEPDSKDSLTFAKSTLFGNGNSNSSSVGFKLSPSLTSSTVFGTPASTSLFGGSGATSSPGTSLFGAPQPAKLSFGGTVATKSIFGGSPAPPGAGIFGASPANPGTGIFGGSSATPGAGIFGASPAAPGTGIFGASPATPGTGIFGGSPAAPSIFGGTPVVPGTGIMGSTTTGGGIFGSNKTATVTPTTTTSIFGKPTTTTPSLFGTPPTPIFVGTQTSAAPLTFGGLKAQSTPGQGEEKPTGGPLGGGPTGNVFSFSDMAKQASQTAMKKSSPTNLSSWVSKPVFSANSPDKDTSHTDDEYDPHYEPVIPLPELVKVTTGEESWDLIFCKRAKVYRFDGPTKQWKERGIGDFKIQFQPTLKKYRFLQRRDQVFKLSCNHSLTANLEVKPMESSNNAWCWLATDFSEKPEGEVMKLAVRFKTEEIAKEFKSVVDACQANIASSAPPPDAIPTPTSVPPLGGVTNPPPEADEDDDEYEDVSDTDDTTGDAAETGDDDDENEGGEDVGEEEEEVDAEEEEEGEEEEEQVTIFSDKCELYLRKDKTWESLGSGELRVCYDDEAYGARIIGVSEEGEKLVDNLISIQTTMQPDAQLSVTWTSLDESGDPVKKVQVKATFNNTEAVENFITAYQEGKEYAYTSGIEETYRNEVPEDLLYYGRANED